LPTPTKRCSPVTIGMSLLRRRMALWLPALGVGFEPSVGGLAQISNVYSIFYGWVFTPTLNTLF